MTATADPMCTGEGVYLNLVLANDGDHEGVSPILALRWCISPAALDEMVVRKVYDPSILIVISRKEEKDGKVRWVETQRIEKGAAEIMDYLTFTKPGVYRIAPAIVWLGAAQQTWYFDKEGGEFRYQIIDAKTGDLDPAKMMDSRLNQRYGPSNVGGHLMGKTLDVTVPAEFFAKEPPRWLAAWANYGFGGKPCDPCGFRKRLLISILWTPLAALLAFSGIALMRTLFFLWNLLLGHRGLQPRELFRWEINPVAIISGPGGNDNVLDSIFFYRRTGEKGEGRAPRAWFMHVLPPLWIALSLVILYSVPSLDLLSSLAWSVGAALTAATLLFIAEGITILVCKWRLAARQRRWAREAAESERARQAARLKIEPEPEDPRVIRMRELRSSLGAAVCTGGPMIADVRALPKERQTLRLKFTALKARICKPYAR
jgi:hypothetical protein